LAKKKVEKPKRKFTRRQLSHWQQQKRRQRFILGIGISVIIAVIGIVSAGLYYQWYLPNVKPLGETVTEVNGIKFSMDYYIKALKFQVGDQYTQYVQYFLDPVVESIQQDELIRQGALELGISVSDDEVDEELKSLALPLDNQAIRDVYRVQLLIVKLKDEYFDPQLPASAQQKYVMAMFLESQSQADEVEARLEAGEDFGELAGELSLDSLTREKNGDLGWRPKGVLDELLGTSVLENFILGYPVGVLSYPIYDSNKTKDLGYWLIEVLERNDETEEAYVHAILLASEEEARIVISRLEAGEDFVQLAEEFSQYGTEGSKADIGWIAEGDMAQVFDDYVFAAETELNVVSGIIRDEEATTSGGYWLFKVLDSDTREISDEDREILVAQIMHEWMELILDDPENTVVSYLDDEMREFAISKVIEG